MVVCVQLAHFSARWLKGYIYSSCYYHHQIGSIHISYCYHIFPWLCAWYVCYIIFCHLLHMRPGRTGILFSLLLCSLWWVQIFGYVLTCKNILVCLYSTSSHYHHCTNLSEGIELIKCLADIFCRVYKIKNILSIIHYTICGAVCFQFTHFSCDDWENIYILCLIIINKSEVWTITHCLGLGHETMVSAVCLSVFLWVICNKLFSVLR